MNWLGWDQFIPFMVTVLGIIFTDLLMGISRSLLIGIGIILFRSYQNSHFLHIEESKTGNHKIRMTLAEKVVAFFNKGAILKELDRVPSQSELILDTWYTRFLDHDIIEILK